MKKDLGHPAPVWESVPMRQRLLDCIVQLNLYEMLTDAETRKVRDRLLEAVRNDIPATPRQEPT